MSEKILRKNPILFPMGIRSGVTENALIVDFLDPNYENEVIVSLALTEDMVNSLSKHIERFNSPDE